AMLTALAAWVMMDAVGGGALLRVTFYTSYLLALAIVALPLQARVRLPGDTLKAAVALRVAVVGAFAGGHLTLYMQLPAFWSNVVMKLAPLQPLTIAATVTGVCFAAAVVGVIALRLVPIPALAWSLFLAAMVMSFTSYVYWPASSRSDFRA